MNSEKYYRNGVYNLTPPVTKTSVSVVSLKIFELLISILAIAFVAAFFFVPIFKANVPTDLSTAFVDIDKIIESTLQSDNKKTVDSEGTQIIEIASSTEVNEDLLEEDINGITAGIYGTVLGDVEKRITELSNNKELVLIVTKAESDNTKIYGKLPVAYSLFDHFSFVFSGLFGANTLASAARALPFLAFELLCVVLAVFIIIAALKRIFNIIFRSKRYTKKRLEDLETQANCGNEARFLRTQRRKRRLSLADSFKISRANCSPYYTATLMLILCIFADFTVMSFAGIAFGDLFASWLGSVIPYTINLCGLYKDILLPLGILALYYVCHAIIRFITHRKIVRIVSAQYKK